MIEKIKTYSQAIVAFVQSLSDVRKLGMMVFLVVVLMITWNGVKVIETNYGLQREIARLEQENEVSELENQNMALENQYFQSEEYLELESRKNFGLAAPGETVIVVPKQVALKHTVPELTLEEADPINDLPTWRKNMNAWLDFFLHRTDR